MSKTRKYNPTVFISSTAMDLKAYREAAKSAALRTQFLPDMQDYFESEGMRPPLKECLKRVDECDLLVVLVAHRYGWIPEDQPAGQRKSITWLECERACSSDKEVLAFIIDPNHDSPEQFKEEYRITEAIRKGNATPELLLEVQQAVESLKDFKAWLNKAVVRCEFTTPQSLETLVVDGLHKWRKRHAAEFEPIAIEADPRAYLQWLHAECGYIDIRGLQVGTGKAHKFGIEQLYIPLTTTSDFSEPNIRKAYREMSERSRRIELHQALKQRQVAIIGDPGSGKTTFLRRIAFTLCQSHLKVRPAAAQKRLGLKRAFFPIFIRLGELSEHIRACCEQNETSRPSLDTDPTWLSHFLAYENRAQNWGLPQDFFLKKFNSGDALFLLDGLDEAPDRLTRERLSELVVRAIQAYSQCAFVVTSRAQAYRGKVVLQDFHQVRIEPLEASDMESFLLKWSQALFYESSAKAAAHHRELLEALRSRAEIRRMARNPVMLTALAVVHWNERRLPEQRSDLYESIIAWLLRSRQQRPRRLNADQCSLHLQQLALAMQLHSAGRQVQVGRRWAAEAIQAAFPEETEELRLAAAERFLTEEEVDSGIVIARGNQLTFWHLTFQEYLAAKALGGKVEQQQQSLLIQPSILHSPEWRETLLLFGGILYRQGIDKVDGFFSAILDTVKDAKKLTAAARCVGLIGAMLHDLAPFNYQLDDPRYREMLNRVMAIFDRKKARNIPVEVRLEAADALGQAGDPRLDEHNLILIPEGHFLMGAQKKHKSGPNYDPHAYPDESPVHQIKLSSYRISRFPVTVAEYRRFIQDGGYEAEVHWQAGGWAKFKEPDEWESQLAYPNRPVVGVSWYEAMAYAHWAGMDLPSEAQWERAARGKSSLYKYPWGNQAPDGKVTNSEHARLAHPSPVGMFPDDRTEEGVLDMGGNVLEWCRDWKDVGYKESSIFYAKSAGSTDPLNDESSAWGKLGDTKRRVIRGGSWDDHSSGGFRCTNRVYGNPNNRINYLGFRVVCSARF